MLFVLLTLAFLVGARFIVHLVVEGRVRASGRQGRASGPDRRWRPGRPARRPRCWARATSAAPARRVCRRRPAKAGNQGRVRLQDPGDMAWSKGTLLADPRRGRRPTRSDRDPSAPGTNGRPGGTACRDGAVSRANDADGVQSCCGTGRASSRSPAAPRGPVEDMLGREPVREELERVGAYLAGEVVMVTGAGGSIGSELCRQIARVGPRRLILPITPRTIVRDPCASSRRTGTFGHGHAGARRLQGGGADPRGAPGAPAGDRLPRRRLQARPDDGAQPRGGDSQQRIFATRPPWRGSPARPGSSASSSSRPTRRSSRRA